MTKLTKQAQYIEMRKTMTIQAIADLEGITIGQANHIITGGRNKDATLKAKARLERQDGVVNSGLWAGILSGTPAKIK